MGIITAVKNIKIRDKAKKRIKQLIESDQEIKLDLGCGVTKRPGFAGIDLSSSADIQWNLEWGLPFQDDSITEIRSDHFFEHLKLSQVVELLNECRRVLIPGGMLDFTVPHIDPYIDAYLRRDWEFIASKISDVPLGRKDLYSTCFDRISWLLLREGEHQSLFDRESITSKVKLAGFQHVTTRSFDQSRDLNFRFSSIYVVAAK